MDGNNRWAKKNNFNIYETYKKGAKNLIKLSEYIFKKYQTETVSAFALSSHNLYRPKKIISQLIKILEDFSSHIIDNSNHNFKIIFIGDYNFLPKNLIQKLKKVEEINKFNKNKLIIFLNYSGKNDILNSLIKISKEKRIINKKNIENSLQTSNLPDPDLIIRTGGFQRLSDFMLYQASFTELFFSKKLWPDFKVTDLDRVILKFNNTKRKFGK